MKTLIFKISTIFLMLFCFSISAATSQELKEIKLLPPQKEGGMPLMQALNERQTTRIFTTEKLPPHVLSNLLWAAWGINRSDTGKRTAPSAVNMQEIEIYVALQDGLYLYDALNHVLTPVLPDDLRAATGKQDFVKDVPVNLVYVADFAKMG